MPVQQHGRLHLAKPIFVFLAQQQDFVMTLFDEMKRNQQQHEGAALQGGFSIHQPGTSFFPVAEACSMRRHHAILCNPLELRQYR